MTTLGPMGRISLRRLLSKLTVLALSASPVAANATISRSSTPRVRAEAPDTDDDDDDLDLDSDAPIDREQVSGHHASLLLGRGLAIALSELPQLDAIHLGATWALSTDPVRREAIARSLEWMFPLVGDSVIIDHLSRDRDPAIRAASARAAWIRRPTGGDPGVLARLSHDADLEVRSIALRSQR
jgi:hypothetical protein